MELLERCQFKRKKNPNPEQFVALAITEWARQANRPTTPPRSSRQNHSSVTLADHAKQVVDDVQDYKDAKWATLVSITFKDPEGKERLWESAERLTRPKGCDLDAIGVAAILDYPNEPNKTPHIVLQKQWRAPADAVVIEIPAGLMDEGESAEECALRELKEETGYVGKVIEGSFGVSPIMFNGKYSRCQGLYACYTDGTQIRASATRTSR
jgi:hypothetical protein